MRDWTLTELNTLAGLYLQNERSFVARRSLQRFVAGEITAREAIERICRHCDSSDGVPWREASCTRYSRTIDSRHRD